MPRINVIHIRPIQLVECENHGRFEILVSFLFLFIVSVPLEVVAHPVELLDDWSPFPIFEVGVLRKERVYVVRVHV